MQSEAIKPRPSDVDDYGHLVSRFREIVRRAVPPGAVVAVVSRGDHELLDLPGRSAWHFPQRSDGAYAGYYPADSAGAIAHLESLRECGAGFIAFPATALWWLNHYDAFRRYLEERYRPVVRDDETCVLYALSDGSGEGANGAGRQEQAERSDQPSEVDARSRIEDLVEEPLRDDVALVFDASHYSRQARMEFRSPATALLHYLGEGHSAGLSPHPLFDAGWYLRRHPEVRTSAANPLIHFLKHSAADGLDPSPYFDTVHYYSQRGNLRDARVNALVHYLTHARDGSAPSPNPLFQQRFYLRQNPDVRLDDATPFEHFLRVGCTERWAASQIHSSIMRDLQRASTRALVRGNWRHGSVLVFGLGRRREGIPDLLAVAKHIQRGARVNTFVVAFRPPPERESGEGVLVLDDYKLACEIYRPAALRLLTKMLVAATEPHWAISEIPDVLEALRAEGVGTYALLPEAKELRSNGAATQYQDATRMIVPSSEAFYAAAERPRELPTRVALAARPRARDSDAAASDEVDRSPRREWADEYAESLLRLANRDFGFNPRRPAGGDGGSREIRKVIIPCADWGVSGVNAALERVGVELAKRGWDIEILFTRDRDWVINSVPDDSQMPSISYRYLERDLPGLEGMWAALIADVEQRAPCILFMAYDFFGNSVAPALTDAVGVVCWVQADDGDYHEQAYRLGRYCNAVVCVSETLQEKVADLNPAIGARTHVIQNSSVSESDILTKRDRRAETMRIAYAGRLVQYQKRVLDFVALAEALDKTGVPYAISLIGSFGHDDEVEQAFKRLGERHVADGRIRLPGRMARPALFAELATHDFFVLLSDFEGFPVAMVEAMARGCVPVAAQSESGIPELIKNGINGQIVSGRDYDEWASLLVRLWGDRRKLARMSRAARRTVSSRFTVEQSAKKFEDLFIQVAKEISEGDYGRAPSLNWGERSRTGDVIPPPSIYRPGTVQVGGLR